MEKRSKGYFAYKTRLYTNLQLEVLLRLINRDNTHSQISSVFKSHVFKSNHGDLSNTSLFATSVDVRFLSEGIFIITS